MNRAALTLKITKITQENKDYYYLLYKLYF